MAYDEDLAQRVLEVLATEDGISTRKMFGGLACMWNGNMVCGVMGSDLMARVGPTHYERLLAEPGAGPMEFTGRPMKGMLTVSGAAVADDGALADWVSRAKEFVGTLPAK